MFFNFPRKKKLFHEMVGGRGSYLYFLYGPEYGSEFQYTHILQLSQSCEQKECKSIDKFLHLIGPKIEQR